jgi:hypothetical protein
VIERAHRKTTLESDGVARSRPREDERDLAAAARPGDVVVRDMWSPNWRSRRLWTACGVSLAGAIFNAYSAARPKAAASLGAGRDGCGHTVELEAHMRRRRGAGFVTLAAGLAFFGSALADQEFAAAERHPVAGPIGSGQPPDTSRLPRPGLSGVKTPVPPGAVLVDPSQFGSVDGDGTRVTAKRRPQLAPTTPATGSAPSLGGSSQPGVGSCTAYDATNPGGGTIVPTARINLLFWGSWDATTANNITATWQRLAGLPAFYTRMAEYGIGQGSYGTRFDYPSGVTGNQPDCTFAGGLSAALSAAHYVPTSDDVFVILLPTITTSKVNIDHGWFGHHESYGFAVDPGPVFWNYTTGTCTNNTNGACSGATYNATNHTCTVNATHTTYSLAVNGTFYNVRYAVVEPAVVDVNVGVSHEVSETVTDPDGTAYVNEIGDPCEGGPVNQIQGITVQKLWSQAACRCVGERDLNGSNVGGGASLPTIYHPSNQSFYPYNYPYYYPTFPVGSPADPFIWDHDGDGLPDYATFYSAATASVSTRLSLPPYYENTYNWGTTGDRFVPGDYDGDGMSDLAVWRPSNGTWYVQYTSNGSTPSQQWGVSSDIPYPGDFDGDGKTDYAVVRYSNGTLYVIPSSNPGSPWAVWSGGLATGDILTPGDYNGDGITDYAWWHPATGTWNVWYLGTDTAWTMNWGGSGDIPVARDYDGDWMADLSVWRPSDGTWYTINSTTWTTTSAAWGASTDVPATQFTALGGF